MRLLQNITHGRLFIGTCYLAIVSLFFSHFLLSLSLIFFVLLTIVRYSSSGKRTRLNTGFGHATKGILKNPYFAFALIFILHLISGMNSENIPEYLRQIQVKAPYLILPIVFLNHHGFTKRQYHRIYHFLILVGCLMTAGVIIHYFIHFEELTLLIGKGGALPTPIHHTKFSVLIAIALNAAIILRIKYRDLHSAIEKKWLTTAILFLLIAIHVLAVRSGLVCFYLGFFIMGIGYLALQRKYIALLALVISSILLPIAAYYTVPSFYKKVGYTLYDLKMYKEGGGQGYNDSERIRSYEVGISLLKRNSIFGVGIGDMEDEVKRVYKEKYDIGNPRQPHNQFLFAAAAFGHLGLLIYVVAYFLTFFWRKAYRDPLLISFFIILIAFCMIEKPLERSSFIVLHCLLVLVAANVRKE